MAYMFDRSKWHSGGEFPKDRPESQGFVHIGMYLTWAVLNNLHDPKFFGNTLLGRDRLGPVKSRKQTACFLEDWLDGSLADNMLSPEGGQFTLYYYIGKPGYLHDWVAEFGDAADDYSVADEWATYDRIAPVIDRRFSAWSNLDRSPLL